MFGWWFHHIPGQSLTAFSVRNSSWTPVHTMPCVPAPAAPSHSVPHSPRALPDPHLTSPSCQRVVEGREVPPWASFSLMRCVCVCFLPCPHQAEAVPQPVLPGDGLARLVQPQRPHGRRQEEEDWRGGVWSQQQCDHFPLCLCHGERVHRGDRRGWEVHPLEEHLWAGLDVTTRVPCWGAGGVLGALAAPRLHFDPRACGIKELVCPKESFHTLIWIDGGFSPGIFGAFVLLQGGPSTKSLPCASAFYLASNAPVKRYRWHCSWSEMLQADTQAALETFSALPLPLKGSK